MSYLILVAILFVAGLLFLPRGVDSGVRNAPLLIGILAVLFVLLVFSLWKRIRLKQRVARVLRAAGYRICHRWRSVFRNRLFAERDGEVFYRDPVKGAAGAFSDLLMSGRDEASELVRDQIF